MAIETFGKYEIRGRLGAGAMGTVYDAFDPVIERRAALKTVRRPEPGDPEGAEAMARFKREAQAAGRLNHPHIVAVYDYGEDAHSAWIAMELVEGGTLKALLDRGERFPLPQAMRLMDQMLAALDYSHGRGVVHRDIKPANIMLTADNQVKIADFGIARIENSAMTQVGTIMGTPAYMAPEQLRGEAVDSRADIWAAGVVLYQLLTGEKPFAGGYSSVQHKALNTEPTPPSALSVTAPRAFDAVIARALAKRPEDRFPTAGAFAEALRGMAATAPAEDATIVAAPARAPAPARPVAIAAASRSPVPLIAAGGGLLAMGAAAYLLLAGGGTPPPASTGTPGPPPGLMAGASGAASPAAGTPPAMATVSPAGTGPGSRTDPGTAPGAGTGVLPAPAGASVAVATGPSTVSATPGPAPNAPGGGAPGGGLPSLQPRQEAPGGSVPGQGSAAPTPPLASQEALPPNAAVQGLSGSGTPAASGPIARPGAAPASGTLNLPPASNQDTKPAEPPRPQLAALPPPRIDFRAAATAAAAAPACALLAASASDTGLVIEGVLRRGEEATLRRVLALRDVPAAAARLSLRPFDGPYCTAFDTLRPVLAAPDQAPRLRLIGNAPLLADQLLRFDVTMPDWPAQLTVSYFMTNGEVAHLAAAAHPAGATVRLGEPRSGFPGWGVSEPFGTDLMLALVSDGPLFATARPDVEPQQAYLAALADALARARAAGRRVMARPMVVETAPR